MSVFFGGVDEQEELRRRKESKSDCLVGLPMLTSLSLSFPSVSTPPLNLYLQRPSSAAPRCHPGTARAWAGPENAAAVGSVASIGDCRRPWRPFPSFFQTPRSLGGACSLSSAERRGKKERRARERAGFSSDAIGAKKKSERESGRWNGRKKKGKCIFFNSITQTSTPPLS